MPLPTASDILRRIQDSIYTLTPLLQEGDDEEDESDMIHHPVSGNDAPRSLSQAQQQPHSSLTNGAFRPTMLSQPPSLLSPPLEEELTLSPSTSDSVSREIDSTIISTRYRQSSDQGTPASEVDAQA